MVHKNIQEIEKELNEVLKKIDEKIYIDEYNASDGKEFFISEADDFEKEVEMLRGSQAFQKFLDERSMCKHRIPLEDIEKEIQKELSATHRLQ